MLKTATIGIFLVATGLIWGQEAPNVVDFSNSPEAYAGKEYEVTIVFNPFEDSVSRMKAHHARHYGGLLVKTIDGETWDSTHLYINKSDSAKIKKLNQMLKGQNVMEPLSFRMRVKYLGKFGDFMGGTHGFELVELLE